MSYTAADFESMTGKELNAVKDQYESVDIAPEGWGKMRVNEKRSWLKRFLFDFRAALRPAELPPHVRGKKAWDARKAEYYALKERVRRHPTPLDEGMSGACVSKLRVIERLAAQNPAADPQPMTRQVRRQKERAEYKARLHARKIEVSKLRGVDRVLGGMASVRAV